MEPCQQASSGAFGFSDRSTVKRHESRCGLLVFLTLLLAGLLFVSQSEAQTLTWINGSTVWDEETRSWRQFPRPPTEWIPDASGEIGAGQTVTVIGTQVGRRLIVLEGTTITGGTLQLQELVLQSNTQGATISSAITSAGNLQLLTNPTAIFRLTNVSTPNGLFRVFGNATFSGAGATVTGQSLDLSGGLRFENGATLTTNNVVASGGTLVLDNAVAAIRSLAAFSSVQVLSGASLTTTAGMSVIDGGSLTFDNAANSSALLLTIGGGGAQAALTNSSLNVAAGLIVGNGNGAGNLTLNTGSTLNVVGGISIGQDNSGGDGTMTLNTGSTLNLSGALTIGGGGANGTLTLGVGTTLTAPSGITIGSVGSTSRITIGGDSTLRVGSGGIVNGGGDTGITLTRTGRLVFDAPASVSVPLTLTERQIFSSPTRIDTNGHNVTYSGSITGLNQTLEKLGSGTLTLTGSNNYGANLATIVRGGLIEFSTPANLSLTLQNGQPSRRVALVGGGIRWAPGNTFDISPYLQHPSSLIELGNATFDTNGNNVTFNNNGAFNASGAPITKIGAGTLTLAVPFNRHGPTNVLGGTLAITNAQTLGTGPVNIATGGVLAGADTLNFNRTVTVDGIGSTITTPGGLGVGREGNGSLAITGGAVITAPGGFSVGGAGTGVVSVTGNGSALNGVTTSFIGFLNGSGTFTVADGGTFTPGQLRFGDSGGSSTFNLNAGGTLRVGGLGGIVRAGGSGTFNFAGGTLRVINSVLTTDVAMVLSHASTIDTNGFDPGLNGALSGAGSLRKTGAGTLTLTSDNSFSGGLTIDQGTVAVTRGAQIGTGAVSVLTGARLDGGAGNLQFNQSVTVTGPGSRLTTTGFLEFMSGTISIDNGGMISATQSTALGLPGNSTANVTGATLDAGGTLFIGVLGGAGAVNINAGGLVRAGRVRFGEIGGSGTLALNSGGRLQVGGTDGLSRDLGSAAVQLAGGNLEVTGSHLTTSLPLTLTATSTIDTNGLGATLSGALSGAGGLIKAGGGTLTLRSAATYAGDTAIRAGTLTLESGGSLTSIANLVTIAPDAGETAELRVGPGGALFAGGTNRVRVGAGAGTLQLAGGTLKVTSEDLALSVPITLSTTGSLIDTSGVTATLNGVLSGTGGFTKTGGGTLFLTQDNTFSGGVTVLGGSVSVGSVSQVGTGPVTVLGGSLQSTNTFRLDNVLTVDGPSSSLTAANFIESGSASGSNASITVTNGGTVQATTSIAFGGLGTGTGSVTGTNSSLTAGTTLFLGFAGSGSLNVSAGGTVTAGTLNLGAAGGSGTFTLGSGGTLQVGGSDGIQTAGTADFRLAGGLLKVINSSLTSSVNMTLSNNSLIDTSGVTTTLFGLLSGEGALSKTGGGSLILTNNNTYTGGTTNIGGTLQLGNGGTTGSVLGNIVNDGTLAFQRSDDITFSSNISGSGSLVQAGAGRLTLSGQTNASSLRVAGGTVAIASGGEVSTGQVVLGTVEGTAGSFRLSSGGTLNVGGTDGIRVGPGGGTFQLAGGLLKVINSSLTSSVNMTLSNNSLIDTSGVTATLSGGLSGEGTLSKTGGGSLILTGNNAHTGGTTIIGGTLQVGDGGTTGSISGAVTNHDTLLFRRGDDYTFQGVISGSGTMRNQGPVLRFVEAQTYTGETRIESGILVLSTTQDFGLASSSLVTIGGGALDISNRQQRIGGLEGTGAVYSFGGSAGNITLDVAAGETHTFSGVLGSSFAGFSLVKDGAGTQVLAGTNNYTGTTTITAGTLLIEGSLTTSSVTVGSGGILGGSGRIGGSLHFNSGGGLLFDAADSLLIDGASVTFDGFGIENLMGLSAATSEGIYRLLWGPATFDFANVRNLGSHNAFDLGEGRRAWFQEGSLQLVVIPEPSIGALLGFSLLGLLARRRR